MDPRSTPYIWLGPGWYAWLELGPDFRHATFTAIAERVTQEFGGSISEVLPNPADDGKEYAELQIGTARLLLMRKPELGIGLGAAYADVPLLLQIGATFHAQRRGWRWPFYWLRQLAGRGGQSN